TAEFFEIARNRLRPSGIFVEPLSISHLEFRAIQAMLKSFTTVFPEVLILSSGKDASDLVLMGSDQPLRIDWNRTVIETTQKAARGTRISRMLFGTREAHAAAGDARENTDNNALVELSAVRCLYRNSTAENGSRLYALGANPWSYVEGAPPIAERTHAMME